MVGDLAPGTPITTAPLFEPSTSQIATVAGGALLDGPVIAPSTAVVARSTTVVSVVVPSLSALSLIESSASPPAGSATPPPLPDAIFAPAALNVCATALIVSAFVLPVS